MINRELEIINYIAFFILFLVMMLCQYYQTVIFSIVTLMVAFLYLVFNCFLDIKKRYLLLLFYLVFFVFTMGQYIFPNYGDWLYYDQYSNSIIIKTIFIQLVALIFTHIGYTFIKQNERKKKLIVITDNLKKCLIVCLLIFLLLGVVSNLEIGYRVLKYGYLIIYSNDVPSVLPSYVKYLASFFPLLVFICLAFFQEKKERKLTILMYFVYLCSTLLTGARGDFCIGMIIIIILIFTQKFIVDKDTISRKRIALLIVISVLLISSGIVGLNVFNSIRNKNTDYNRNTFAQFSNFFVNQGTSVNVISLSLDNQEKLDIDKHIYTLGPIFENIEYKIQKFVNIDLIGDRHTSLAKDISIIGLGKDTYMSGQGLGSQYLAELYLDYNIFGVIFFSIFIGIFINILSDFYKYNYLGYSLCLMLIQSIVFLPRSQALQFINTIISFNYWVLIVIFTLLVIFIKKKVKNYV